VISNRTPPRPGAATAAASAQLVEATLQVLREHAPFDTMEPDALRFLAARLRVAYYPRGAEITGPASGVAGNLFIVKKGRVRGSSSVQPLPADVDFVHGAGECFPVGSLIEKRPTAYSYRAEEDCFCYVLGAEDFQAVLDRSPKFLAFCTDYLAALLGQSRRALRIQAGDAMTEQGGMLTPLRLAAKREPASCTPETPIAEVLRIMHDRRVGSVVVTNHERVPVGIFTTPDVLERVALPQYDVARPIEEVMSRDPVTLDAESPLFEAALAMARHGIRHVICVRDGRLSGVISERDLFGMQRVGLRNIADRVRRIDDLGGLIEAAADVRQLCRNLLAQGVAAEQLTQMVSALNDRLVERTISIVARRHALPDSWCWLALGSEGRVEQTLATDQDNALIFTTAGDLAADRARLVAFADEVNRALADEGFPLCRGEIMARNPRWCLTVAEWQAVFGDWIRNPLPEALLNASIFFDFRPLAGEARLAGDLREWVLGRAEGNASFRRAMTENALRVRPPLGLVRDFTFEASGEHPGTLNLKNYGARPFVDAARVIALASRIGETSTVARLRAAGAAGKLPAAEAAAAVEAFHFIQTLRLRQQSLGAAPVPGGGNRIAPDSLHAVDRRILKEAFRQAASLQERLRLDYQI
jgi:CBS domain-containing protein